MADYFRKVISGAALIFAANAAASIFSYLLRFSMTSNLTPVQYGLFYACMSLVSLLIVFSDFGLTHSVIYHISKYKAEGDTKKLRTSIVTSSTLQMALGIIFAAIFFFSSSLIISDYLHLAPGSETAQEAVFIIGALSLSIFIASFMNIAASIIQGFQDMKLTAMMEFSRMFFWFILTTIFFYLNFSWYSPVLGLVLAYVLVAVIFLLLAKGKVPKDSIGEKSRMDGAIAKDLFTYGFPIMISLAIGYVISYTDTIMITFFRTLEEVSLYQTAQPIAAIIWTLSSAIVVVLFPLIAEAKVKDMKIVEEGMAFVYKYVWLFVVPAALIAFSFSTEILALLFGPAYVGGTNVLKLLAIGAVFFSVTQINGSVLNSLGKPDRYKNVVYIGAAVNIVGNILLVPVLGVEGAALATLISYIFMLFGSFGELGKVTGISMPLKEWGKTIIAGLIGLGAIYIVKALVSAGVLVKIILGLSVFGVVFFSLLLVMKVIDLKEIERIIRKGLM